MNIVPPWAYWLVIAALAATVGVERTQVANGKAALATEKAAREAETAARWKLVSEHADEMRDKESQHAADQQQKVEAYEAKIAVAQHAAAVDRADAQRVRGQLAAFTTSDSRPGETDAAACQRFKDRLPVVGTLLAEGVELEAESRAIIQRRDAEVTLLLGQIETDRRACSP